MVFGTNANDDTETNGSQSIIYSLNEENKKRLFRSFLLCEIVKRVLTFRSLYMDIMLADIE